MTDEQILACNNTAAEDQEFSPCITAPDEDLIAFARQVLHVAGGALPRGWASVERGGMPPCDGETVFVGINSAGFACCFNEARPDGLCLMGSPECSTAQMSELRWWRVLDRPAAPTPQEE